MIGGSQITKDHIIPKIKGGNKLKNNVVWCCVLCNQLKSSMSYRDFVKEMETLRPLVLRVPLETGAIMKFVKGRNLIFKGKRVLASAMSPVQPKLMLDVDLKSVE